MRFGAGSSVAIGSATAAANAVKTSPLEDEPEIFTLVMKGDELGVRAVCETDPSSVASALESGSKSTPLHLAAYLNHAGMAQDLAAVSSGSMVNAKDCRGVTPLHRAARNNNMDVVVILLGHYADVGAKDKVNWQTPKHVAAANGALDSLKVMLDNTDNKVSPSSTKVAKKTNKDGVDRFGRTCLHLAAGNGQKAVCEYLLSKAQGNTTDVDAKDKKGRTSLHYAMLSGNADIVTRLMEAGADPKSKDKDGMTPLHALAMKSSGVGRREGGDGRWFHQRGGTRVSSAIVIADCVLELVRAGDDVLQARDNMGNTPLHTAAANFNSDVLNAFVDCAKRPKHLCQLNDKIPVDTSALFDMRNLRGETVLHVAAAAVAPDDPPSDESGESGCFSMDIELESSLDTCLEIVISEMTNNNNSTVGINSRNEDGQSALHLACVHGCVMRAKALLDAGCDPRAEDNRRQTPLHLAAAQGHTVVMDMLLKSGVGDPACLTDEQGRTPLHVLAASPQSTSVTVRQLLQAASLSGPESILEARDNEGRTCLHYSALGSSDTMECLLDAGAALDARDSKMRTALHYAAGRPSVELVTELTSRCLGEMRSEVIEARDVFGRSALHYACEKDTSGEVVKLLIRAASATGKDQDFRDNQGLTPLHAAASRGNSAAVIEISSDPIFVRMRSSLSSNGITGGNGTREPVPRCSNPVYLAAEGGHRHTLQALLVVLEDTHQAINSRDPLSGMTALEVACLRGHRDTVKALLDFRPNFFPPWTAFKTTKSECQQKLVGSPALHRASEEGHLECVQLLLEHTSNLESVSLKKVVNFRLDPKLGGDGSTALMKAASRGHVEVCELLIETGGADVNVRRKSDGMTAVYMAATSGRTDCCQLLLDHGADANLCDTIGWKSPLHAVAAIGNLSVLCTLIDHLDSRDLPLPGPDRDGLTPLHWAAFKGHEACVQLLMNKWDADQKKHHLSKKSSQNPTTCEEKLSFFDAAVIGKSPDSLKILMDNPGGPSTVGVGNTKIGRLGYTTLHLAAVHNSVECLRLLLSSFGPEDPRLEVCDHKGRTPVMLAASRGHSQIVKLLVQIGRCKLDSADSDGNTLLHHCCMVSQIENSASLAGEMIEAVFKSPKSKALDVSHQNKEGKTALHLAGARGFVSATESLLGRGASVTVTDNRALNPLLACAPNDDVVICLGMMLSVFLSSNTMDSARDSLLSVGSSNCGDVSRFSDVSAVTSNTRLSLSRVLSNSSGKPKRSGTANLTACQEESPQAKNGTFTVGSDSRNGDSSHEISAEHLHNGTANGDMNLD